MRAKDVVRLAAESGQDKAMAARTPRHARSIRTLMYNAKRELPAHLCPDDMAIRIDKIDEALFVVIYHKPENEKAIYNVLPDGTLEPMGRAEYDATTRRIIELMRQDGKSDDEIRDVLKLGKDEKV